MAITISGAVMHATPELPHDVVYEIGLSLGSANDLLQLCKVNRAMFGLTHDNKFWYDWLRKYTFLAQTDYSPEKDYKALFMKEMYHDHIHAMAVQFEMDYIRDVVLVPALSTRQRHTRAQKLISQTSKWLPEEIKDNVQRLYSTRSMPTRRSTRTKNV